MKLTNWDLLTLVGLMVPVIPTIKNKDTKKHYKKLKDKLINEIIKEPK